LYWTISRWSPSTTLIGGGEGGGGEASAKLVAKKINRNKRSHRKCLELARRFILKDGLLVNERINGWLLGEF